MVGTLDWIIVIAYMVLMVLIGFYSKTKMSTYEDHILAGRNVPWYYLAPCLLTTQIGAGSLMGYAGQCFDLGISGAWWVYSNIIVFLAMGLLGAKKFRRAVSAKTLPELFEIRYDKKSANMVAICTCLTELAYTAGQIVGGGLLLSVVMGWDLGVSTLVFAAVVMIYSAVGGMWAVFLTDFVQMVVMYIGLGALVILGVKLAGGMSGLKAAVPASYFNLKGDNTIGGIVASILYAIPAIFCSFDIVQKVMAAKTPKDAKTGSLVASGLVIPFAIMVPLIGMLGYVILGDSLSNHEMVTCSLIAEILPTGLKGLAVAAVLSTLMSSCDACLIATSSVFVNDIVPMCRGKNAEHKEMSLKTTILVTAAIGVLSYIIGNFLPSAMTLMEYAWTLLACGAFIPLMACLFWKKSSAAGCWWSLIIGAAVGLGWTLAGNPFGLKAVIPSYIVGIIAMVAGSLVKPDAVNKAEAIYE